LEDQLRTTFKDFTRVQEIGHVVSASSHSLYLDEHIPNLVAVSPNFEVLKTRAYKSGAIILQDKASCFPAYLLDPRVEDGDIIDSCAAPGNKTTHLAAIISSRTAETDQKPPNVFAFERNGYRAKTLENMVSLAGGKEIIHVTPKQDFLLVDPDAKTYRNVGCLLLDPSCSGSGIVDREGLPPIHLPDVPESVAQQTRKDNGKKRKRKAEEASNLEGQVLVDDDGQQVVISSEQELLSRLSTLSAFQLTLLQHAFRFPAAKRITYSTCSIHAQENEEVVLKALHSDIAKARGWRILKRNQQVNGMRKWPVRGSIDATDGDETIADACIRTFRDDGRGVMGFFVAAFVRVEKDPVENESRNIRNENGQISQGAVETLRTKQARVAEAGSVDDQATSAKTSAHEVDSSDGWEGFED
jgi:25S rRNA (cytosine2278-C5)-methyltransferase